MEITTLKDLKDFLGTLSEDQLKQEATLGIVDSHYEKIKSGIVSDEDWYIDDYGSNPVSTFEPSDEDDKLENYDIIPAGHVSLLNE